MDEKEILYSIALSLIPSVGVTSQRFLLNELGSAGEVYAHRYTLNKALPEINPKLAEMLTHMDEYLPRAEEEMEFMDKGHIRPLCFHDEHYPARLRECPDAPIILYYRGTADLNARHIISMVGTRKITEYGKDFCASFLRELRTLCPDTLVISGLAYGVDIRCHREALDNGLETIGVLAHGLDRIYPEMHRATAVRMASQGGLLTEYTKGTATNKALFVQRNRIVAGISDATIVVESAEKGGSLITADIADGYYREVFAVPGRIYDPYSKGCNTLIKRNKAAILTDAASLVAHMGWETKKDLKEGIQQTLFPDLTPEEQHVVDELQQCEGMQVNILSVRTRIPIGRLSSLLFSLEMKNVVKMLNGGTYRLCTNMGGK